MADAERWQRQAAENKRVGTLKEEGASQLEHEDTTSPISLENGGLSLQARR